MTAELAEAWALLGEVVTSGAPGDCWVLAGARWFGGRSVFHEGREPAFSVTLVRERLTPVEGRTRDTADDRGVKVRATRPTPLEAIREVLGKVAAHELATDRRRG